MKFHRSLKSTSRNWLWEMLTELGHVVRQSIADSWLTRIGLATTGALTVLFLWTRIVNILTTQGFGPHGACLLWLPGLITLYAGSDSAIGLAYVSISATLISLVYTTRHTIPFRWVFVAFGIFIIACGATHFLDVWTLWVPVYWLLGMVKLLTALASMITALALPPLVPKVASLIRLAHASDEHKRQLEQAHHELEMLYKKSQELDRLKTTFFANVSHELRTPLTLILGPTRGLLATPHLTGEQQQALEVVQRNALTLLKQVNDLLALAQCDMGQMTLNAAQTDLVPLLRECTAHFAALAKDRLLTFTVDSPSSVSAFLDAEKIQHICLNILSNAFKFTPAGGVIRCILSQEGNEGILTVQDSGPGIRPEQRQAIFERFRQGDDSLARQFGGTGLGLAIVKEFVDLHQGSIAVEDAPEGGALFTIRLPLGTQLFAEQVSELSQVPASQVLFSPVSVVSAQEAEPEPGWPAESSQAEVPDDSRPLVLVIEDHQDMAHLLVTILRQVYRVAVARDGQNGLVKALTLNPDLILCDLMMPHMSGEQFIRQARTHHTLDAIPLMVLSARADDTLRVQLLREGVQEYLVKPFFPEELRVRTANLIAMKQARQVLQQEVATQNQSLVLLATEVAVRKRESQQALTALQHVNEQLAQASQLQRNFVAIVSHEFRTTLTGIQGFSDIMRQEQLSQQEIQEYAADIFAEATRLSRMITNLLDLERMKSGRMSLLLERININALLKETLKHFQPATSEYPIEFQLDETLPECMGDRDKLVQVVTNLLSNAVKYSPRGGAILLGSQVEAEMARVWIQDHGIGIPPEALEGVFISYSRVEAEPTRYIKGSGLGLSIARQIIQMHGGRIWAESSLGLGSRFCFTIPLAKAFD